MLAHINIGSNIGDSRPTIERAVADVFSISDGITRRSSIIESEPWGFDSPNKFLNIGVEIETSLSPEKLLDILQEIEHRISPEPHRNPDGSYRDRAIDIDLIFMTGEKETDTIRYSSPRLTLPHPRAASRQFVIGPIRELHPETPIPEATFL